MNTRVFGKTGRSVGEIGLGTWQLGANWGEVTDEVAGQTLRAALESGVTFLIQRMFMATGGASG